MVDNADLARWIALVDALGAMDDPRCVTVTAGGTAQESLAVFRVDPSSLSGDLFEQSVEDGAAGTFQEVPGGSAVIELNGWAGSANGVVRRASQHGRAGVFYWSVNADSSLILAENGRILCSVEALHIELPLEDDFFDEVCLGEDPRVLGPLLDGLDFEIDWIASAMTVIERFTGVVIPEETWFINGPKGSGPYLVPAPTDEDYEESPADLEPASYVEGGADYPLSKGDPSPAEIESDSWPEPITGKGSVWAWGYRWGGALGDGSTSRAYRPVAVAGLDQVTALFARGSSAFAVRTDGSLWAWGVNEEGQLGVGHKKPVLAPSLVSGIGGVRSVFPGYENTYAITDDGQLWAWGRTFRGTLGDGVTNKSTKPIPLNIAGVVAVADEMATTYAVTDRGQVWAWGDGGSGTLGDGIDHKYPAKEPQLVAGIPPVVSVHTGRGAVVARCRDGSVVLWGGSYSTVDDTGAGEDRVRLPVVIPGLVDIIAISGGCALKSDGTVWIWRQQLDSPSWGYSNAVTIGGPAAAPNAEPQEYGFAPVPQQHGEVDQKFLQQMIQEHNEWAAGQQQLAHGQPHDASDEPDPDVLAFCRLAHEVPEDQVMISEWHPDPVEDYFPRPDGRNARSNDTYTDSLMAFQVPGLQSIIAISCGERFHALRDDGTVWSWGPGMWQGPELPNLPGDRLPVRVPGLKRIVSLAENGAQVAVDSDGVVWTWYNGGNAIFGNGRPDAPEGPLQPIGGTRVDGLTGVRQIACDGSAVFALLP